MTIIYFFKLRQMPAFTSFLQFSNFSIRLITTRLEHFDKSCQVVNTIKILTAFDLHLVHSFLERINSETRLTHFLNLSFKELHISISVNRHTLLRGFYVLSILTHCSFLLIAIHIFSVCRHENFLFKLFELMIVSWGDF